MPNPEDTSYLRTDGLAVGYGGRVLIGGVNVDVRPGSIVTLIGPNGAGKSTILKTIAGQLRALGGCVYLCGQDMAEASRREVARQLSVMLTDRVRTELLTCGDVVETARYPYTGRMGRLGDRDRQAVERAMRITSTWDLRERDFMHVSDGQRQRVMLARALCQEPRVLVLDAPTSYLDVRYQIELLGTLRSLAKTGEMSVVMSLHELQLARIASDWVVCVGGGRIVAQGEPQRIFVPQVIDPLYGLAAGTYDPATGAIRLPEPDLPGFWPAEPGQDGGGC